MTYGIRDVDGRLAELCDECGFDGREAMDLQGRLTAGYTTLADLARHADAHLRPEALVSHRPAPVASPPRSTSRREMGRPPSPPRIPLMSAPLCSVISASPVWSSPSMPVKEFRARDQGPQQIHSCIPAG